MWPVRISNPGPLTYESGALPTALRGPAIPLFIKLIEVTLKIKDFPPPKIKVKMYLECISLPMNAK